MAKNKSLSNVLLENSISAALSSVEIYNKPDFKYREEIFTILNINSWELLLKAKILKDSNEKIESLYIIQDGVPKKTRNGSPMTLEAIGAMNKLKIDDAVIENLKEIINIRDSAIHFINEKPIKYLVFTLGVASLKNYQKLIKDWFDKSLAEYNFYIMPLAFAYDFKTLSLLELDKQKPAVSALMKSVTSNQERLNPASGYYFVCEIFAEIKTAKKFSEGVDLRVAVDSTSGGKASVILKTQRLIDKYPLNFRQLIDRIMKEQPLCKLNMILKIMKDSNLRFDDRYSGFNFRSKAQEEKFKVTHSMPRGIPSIYNEDAARFIVQRFKNTQ